MKKNHVEIRPQIREDLYLILSTLADREKRSINQQAAKMLEDLLAKIGEFALKADANPLDNPSTSGTEKR